MVVVVVISETAVTCLTERRKSWCFVDMSPVTPRTELCLSGHPSPARQETRLLASS